MQKRFSSPPAIILFLLPIVAAVLCGQSSIASPPSPRTAAEAYHNIQVLKDIPADNLVPAMQFITYSLGVECGYCHVEGALEKDDKKTKLTARRMMQMMFAINRDNFDSKQVVTCNSCHRGSPHPTSIPVIAEFEGEPKFGVPAEGATTVVNAPSPEEIIARYINAIGGANALAKVKTRQERGTIAIGGRSLPLEIITSSGGKQLTLIHLPNGDSITAYDGASGWTSAPNRPVHAIPAIEVVSARTETDLQLPIHMKNLFDELKSMQPANIGDRETYVVTGFSAGDMAAKFYFDKESGYLLRIVRYTKTPVGQSPTQIDYEDYRVLEGTKVPFRFTISRPNSRLAVQIEEVKFNVLIDDRKFAQPPSAPAPNPPSS
jgi:photosynthetic reaction center cytochrome c subunit